MKKRSTAQRRAIKDVIESAGRPLSPQEVLDGAQRACPGLGVATVYRALKELTNEGWLVPVELPGEPPRYERSGLAHHHHFHCRGCGGVFDVEGCVGDMSHLVPAGFVLENHEVVLYGQCSACT